MKLSKCPLKKKEKAQALSFVRKLPMEKEKVASEKKLLFCIQQDRNSPRGYLEPENQTEKRLEKCPRLNKKRSQFNAQLNKNPISETRH